MARQVFIPDHGMMDEEGTEEIFVPGVGMLNEDQAAAAPAGGDDRIIYAVQGGMIHGIQEGIIRRVRRRDSKPIR